MNKKPPTSTTYNQERVFQERVMKINQYCRKKSEKMDCLPHREMNNGRLL